MSSFITAAIDITGWCLERKGTELLLLLSYQYELETHYTGIHYLWV